MFVIRLFTNLLTKKLVYLDKFSIIANVSQVWTFFCDLTNFV